MDSYIFVLERIKMDLYIIVLDVTEWELEVLVRFYQTQQTIHRDNKVHNLLDVSFTSIGGEWVLSMNNSRDTYPKTLAQRGLWVNGLAGFLKNILGKKRVIYNEC